MGRMGTGSLRRTLPKRGCFLVIMYCVCGLCDVFPFHSLIDFAANANTEVPRVWTVGVFSSGT
ncbi:uncharacterized protein BDV17DRAFT_277970 [Aspergillus undulatus]|uniref:uncharacterized protein n=1 Tax=Aspergillus undulatus TaxID=1810928 RepID=UPI003CCE02EF